MRYGVFLLMLVMLLVSCSTSRQDIPANSGSAEKPAYVVDELRGTGTSRASIESDTKSFINYYERSLDNPNTRRDSIQLEVWEWLDHNLSNKELSNITITDADNGIVFFLNTPDSSTFVYRIDIPETPEGEKLTEDFKEFFGVAET
jgi:hypothetical protein